MLYLFHERDNQLFEKNRQMEWTVMEEEEGMRQQASFNIIEPINQERARVRPERIFKITEMSFNDLPKKGTISVACPRLVCIIHFMSFANPHFTSVESQAVNGAVELHMCFIKVKFQKKIFKCKS